MKTWRVDAKVVDKPHTQFSKDVQGAIGTLIGLIEENKTPIRMNCIYCKKQIFDYWQHKKCKTMYDEQIDKATKELKENPEYFYSSNKEEVLKALSDPNCEHCLGTGIMPQADGPDDFVNVECPCAEKGYQNPHVLDNYPAQ